MKAIFGLILISAANFGRVYCLCNLGIGRSHPDQIPVHELYQRIVALRGEEEQLTLLFRYIPTRNVKNVNLTYVHFYLDIEHCYFDISTPVEMQTGFQVRFSSTESVQELSGNAIIYGVPFE